MTDRLLRLYQKPKHADILHFLKTMDATEIKEMYDFADRVRRCHVGDAIHLRAIIEFSNHCRNHCLYCGINKADASIHRYRMTVGQILEAVRLAAGQGFRTVVLQSGEDLRYKTEDVLHMIRGIKQETGMAVTLAVGEKEEDEYRAYFEAGADRFLLKHETSDRDLYRKLNPGRSYDQRIACLKSLKRIGFQTGSGIMVGLPGQTLASIADDILLFRELDIDMIGCGPFIPHPHTELGGCAAGSVDLTFRVVALTRIVTRDTHIPSTTALSTIDPDGGRELALKHGANVVMPNLTPQPYRSYYEIYPNKFRTEVHSSGFMRRFHDMAASLGRFIAEDPGHRTPGRTLCADAAACTDKSLISR